ncbi:hypothetical protein E3N88_13093 [Mikania micrantha]|uniref:Uncharacterized protein n=1 Tax=Mikania micrantha TaxID=192012 RepID=A0A5N6P9B7_9ASTR|nr:hypothetical protein E3N88_13093 [Mikania micrantha]
MSAPVRTSSAIFTALERFFPCDLHCELVMDTHAKESSNVDGGDDGSLNSNVASSMDRNDRKKRKFISPIWAHYEILETKPGEELMCKCKSVE